jgi:DNA-binding winged helix-turn-helix (wHTH) protein
VNAAAAPRQTVFVISRYHTRTSPVTPPIRFRFENFVLSPRHRLLLRDGAPLPLIPKYFDLLVLLVRRRHEAVSKQAIFAEVWSDVIVSDGALSQAIRTLRRALNDNPREPRFIRTVSRHGYQFVCADLREEADEGELAPAGARPTSSRPTGNDRTPDSREHLVDRLFAGLGAGEDGVDDVREAAERLHALGTTAAIALITGRPDHADALAVMRDTRWSVPGAGDVPLDAGSSIQLIRLRMGDARRTMARRWAGAAGAGAIAGALAGGIGGLVLSVSAAPDVNVRAALALAAIGAAAGAVGAGAIGAGLAAAEVLARSQRGVALAACGALAGGIVAAAANVVLHAILEGLIGARNLRLPGILEGLIVGGVIGLAYGVATRQPPGGGVAAPVGRQRLGTAAVVGTAAALTGAALALADRMLVGGLVNEIAQSSPDAQLVLAPLGQLIGEPDFGPMTRVVLSAFEAGIFGAAVTWGLTIRPKSAASH